MPEFRGHQFDEVRNAVTDLGIDNTGGSSVTEDLHDIPGGTLAVFPDGEYLFGQPSSSSAGSFGSTGGASIGIVAKSAWDAYNNGNVTDPYFSDNTDYDDIYTSDVNFRPDPKGGKIRAIRIGKSATTNVLVEGITLDHSGTSAADDDSGTLGITLGIGEAEDIDIRNVDHSGRAINYQSPGNEEIAIAAGTESPTGEVLVHGCNLEKMHDRTLYGPDSGNAAGRMGYYTGITHYGVVEFNECSASEVGNNAWYCSAPVDDRTDVEARVIIDNCYVENAGPGGFRISGGSSIIRNSEAVYDSSLYTGQDRKPSLSGSRPIWFETSTPGTEYAGYTYGQQQPGVTVENTTVTMRDCHKPGAAIGSWQTAREVNVVNCEVDIDGVDLQITSTVESDAAHGWIMQAPYTTGHGGNQPGEDPRGLKISNSTIIVRNTTSNSSAHSVVSAMDANNTNISGTCIQEENNGYALDGVTVELYNSTDYYPFNATIRDSNINVTGNEVVNIGGNNVTQDNITTTETCGFGDEPVGGTGDTFSDAFDSYL